MMNDASTPAARQLRLEPSRVPAAQVPRWFAVSSAALGVAAHLVSAAPACAHDTKPAGAPREARSAAPAPSAAPASIASLPVLAPLADPALLLPIVEQSQDPSAAAAKPAPSPS